MYKKPNFEELEIQIAELKKQNEILMLNTRVQKAEISKRAEDLVVANIELDFQNEEKLRHAAELIIANVELSFQHEEKKKRAAELINSNIKIALQSKEKEKLAAELIIANLALSQQNELLVAKEKAEENERNLRISNEEYLSINEELRQTNEEFVNAKLKAEENEAKIKEQSRLLDLIFEYSLDSIVLLDKDYNFIKVSKTYATACQKEISEFAGKNHFDIYPSSLKEEFDACKNSKTVYQRKSRPFEFPDHPEYGVTFWNLGLVPFIKNNQIEMFLFSLKNVTENVRFQEKLVEAKEKAEVNELKFKTLFNLSPDPIFIMERQTGIITLW